jgi:hypothetical protein
MYCEDFNNLYFQTDETTHHCILAVHNYMKDISAGHAIERSSDLTILRVFF